jgi:ubiquinone/menaquinone biosynthesis C-methylase UbiE
MSERADPSRHYDELETRLTAFVSERMLDLARLRDGMRVLDLASGRGEPALRAAHRVGTRGQVVGVDVAEAVLEIARERAKAAGLENTEFRRCDAETVDEFGRTFDVATSRWGLMYLQAPERALEAVWRSLVPGARLVAALWAEPERVPWSMLPRRVTERYAQLPPIDVKGPGPFRYATLRQIETDFAAAGFEIEHVEELETPVVEVDSGEGIVDWARAVLRRMVDCVPEARREDWAAELSRAAEAYRSGATIRLGGVTRVVVGRRTRG